MNLKTYIFLFSLGVIVLITACKPDEYDGEYFAKEYCNCMKENNADKDFFDARSKCDGILLSKNRFFRINYIEIYHGRYAFMLSESLRDSVNGFTRKFYRYLEKNCCKLSIEGCDKNDSMQIRRKLIDTLGIKY